ncbi:hypothetical protein JAAARDRAFT_447370 [Jaapia argillacea MUCL 33604]|uniref:Uncharacterized protein n=1 Tax=Jaapia argillacea MUCL 33604 TaxID=933084 RepID=A0A067QHF4_9AGAM|nr:hypothetical protein JAAARDRAFT_447370 [Jaapia argillacea MUCL 33604]
MLFFCCMDAYLEQAPVWLYAVYWNIIWRYVIVFNVFGSSDGIEVWGKHFATPSELARWWSGTRFTTVDYHSEWNWLFRSMGIMDDF